MTQPLFPSTISTQSPSVEFLTMKTIKTTVTRGPRVGTSPCLNKAIKQRIQSSHIPPCHRHMVIATNLSSLFDLLHCSIPQTRTECCPEFTVVSGYRMFLGLSGAALPPPPVPVRRDHAKPTPNFPTPCYWVQE